MRVKGIEKKYTGLLRVDVPLLAIQIEVWTTKPGVEVVSMLDVRPRRRDAIDASTSAVAGVADAPAGCAGLRGCATCLAAGAIFLPRAELLRPHWHWLDRAAV